MTEFLRSRARAYGPGARFLFYCGGVKLPMIQMISFRAAGRLSRTGRGIRSVCAMAHAK
jgi:hypothetical protein